jgi:hypothetical protein
MLAFYHRADSQASGRRRNRVSGAHKPRTSLRIAPVDATYMGVMRQALDTL